MGIRYLLRYPRMVQLFFHMKPELQGLDCTPLSDGLAQRLQFTCVFESQQSGFDGRGEPRYGELAIVGVHHKSCVRMTGTGRTVVACGPCFPSSVLRVTSIPSSNSSNVNPWRAF